MKLILAFLRYLPKRKISFLTGLFVELELPSFILLPIIKLYVNFYKVELDEVKEPLESFKTFNEFFTRELKEGVREISKGEALVSPVDGTFFQAQKINDDRIIQVKGLSYNLEDLLSEKPLAENYKNGTFLNFYLSPKDYHNVHMPLAGKVKKITHIPGDLWPVNMCSVENIEGLYVRNERVVVEVETEKKGRFLLIMVGALNVGSIRLGRFSLKTNLWGQADEPNEVSLQNFEEKDLLLKKGEKLGAFCLGSTVLLIFKERFSLDRKIEDEFASSMPLSVKYGESLF